MAPISTAARSRSTRPRIASAQVAADSDPAVLAAIDGLSMTLRPTHENVGRVVSSVLFLADDRTPFVAPRNQNTAPSWHSQAAGLSVGSFPGNTAMSEYEFTVALSIRHPSMTPSRITEALGVEPQHTWKAGDPRRDATGGDLGGVYRETYWMGRLMDEPQLSSAETSIESVLLQTLTQLRRSQPFLEQLSTDGGVAELAISLFARENFRLELSSDSLALLGRLRLSVALDVQPHALTQPPVQQSN
jgi:hypothetical protein